MSHHNLFAKSLLAGSAAVMALSLAALPGLASAQSYGDNPPPPYNDNCHRDHTGSTIVGALIGAGIGALFGGGIAADGHRGDGAALGAGVGAVGGGLAGSSASKCDDRSVPPPQGYYDNGQGPGYADRGPPPPPPGYYDNRQDGGYADAPPPPPGYQNNGDYRDGPPPSPGEAGPGTQDQGYDDQGGAPDQPPG